MSVVFMDDQHRALADINDATAALFIAITRAAATYYGLPSGLSDVVACECTVDRDQFSTLVKSAQANPQELLYSWASYAAGIYDLLTGRRHIWHWTAADGTPLAVEPRYYGVSLPKDVDAG